MFRQTLLLFCLLLPVLAMFPAAPAGAQTVTTLYGAGSTFAAPLYLKWFQEYKAQTGITISYQAIGSGGGIKNITAHAVDFGASDAPLSDAGMQAAPGIVHVPMVAQTVVIVYNLPGIRSGLHLTGPIIAAIYLGKITRWNDPKLVRLNPDLPLPDLAIFPVHLANGSGTTYTLTTYLSAVSPDWKESVGAGKQIHWPVGLGAKQGVGVPHFVKMNEGGVGYVELNYVIPNHIPWATIQNAKGNFVSPTVESTVKAVEAIEMSPDLRGSIVNSPAPNGYPIVGFTYLLAYRTQTKPAVKDLLTWCLTTGQKDAAGLLYAPLPPNARQRALALVAGMK